MSDILRTMPFDCPYLPGQTAIYDIFYADNLNGEELSFFLSRGWRKFSTNFFRPRCPDCKQCVPVRVLTTEFCPTKSQRRVIRKNENVFVTFDNLEYSNELYELYKEHSQNRFGKNTDRNEFEQLFFSPPCESLISKYSIENKIIAGGFLDIASDAFSSIYFVYSNEFAHLSPGTFSTIVEINEALKRGKSYYYLGFYIKDNHHMNYKNRFLPFEFYDWEKEKWIRHDVK